MINQFIIEIQKILYFGIFQFKTFFLYWIIGIVSGSILTVFAADKISLLVARLNDNRFSIRNALIATMLGAASPICMYGTIPLVAVLSRKGVADYLIAAFMVSSILINPNLFIFSLALGVPLAFTRLFLSQVAGIIAGLMIYIFFRKKQFFCFKDFKGEFKTKYRQPSLKILIYDIYRAIRITGPFFLIGLILTALSERYLSQELIKISFGDNYHLGVILAASLGVPIYVCGGGTIPLLKTWLDNGMAPGAAIAFMIMGPATKITNLSALKIILGIKNLSLFILFNLSFAVLSGIMINWLCQQF